jgi:hypothetical protein
VRFWEWLKDYWFVLVLSAFIVITVAFMFWYEYRYPCKRYESYACTQTNCNKIGDVTVCNSYDTTCTRCVERYTERPE